MLALGAGIGAARLPTAEAAGADAPHRLPAVRAAGVRVDTLFLGGYAAGGFAEAVATLNSDLSQQERTLVGTHLDRIFAGALAEGGMGRTGRLRVAYERSTRPDGTTRSIRVLAAEAAVAGELHTALFYERDGRPGYYDPFGRSLDPQGWVGPLERLRVTSPYGLGRMHPILRRVLPHTGVDYAAAAGTPVRATGDGVVVHAGWRGGYGNLVEVQHPSGYSTRYAHLSQVAPGVSAGSFVRQGALVGRVGSTGLATGPHLHYELRRQGRPVDPERVAAAGLRGDLAADLGWAGARGRLSRLLARTPTMAD